MAQLTEQTENQSEEEIEEEEVVDSQPEEVEEKEQPATEGETPDVEAEKEAQESEGEESEEDEDGELVIEIEGESPDPAEEDVEKKEAPEWVKRTRKENRELNKKLKQREKELEEARAKLNPKPTIPDEPRMWEKDHNGEVIDTEAKLLAADRYRNKLIADQEAEEKAKQEQIEKESARVKERLDKYAERKEAIAKRVPDYVEHVAEAENTLNQTQRDAIAYYFQDKAAEIMYIIGKDEDRLEKLSNTSDPVEMLLAVKDIQTSMKTRTRKPSTKPETEIRGQTKVKTSNDVLEAARKRAEQTNDYTEVNRIKREMRKKGS